MSQTVLLTCFLFIASVLMVPAYGSPFTPLSIAAEPSEDPASADEDMTDIEKGACFQLMVALTKDQPLTDEQKSFVEKIHRAAEILTQNEILNTVISNTDTESLNLSFIEVFADLKNVNQIYTKMLNLQREKNGEPELSLSQAIASVFNYFVFQMSVALDKSGQCPDASS